MFKGLYFEKINVVFQLALIKGRFNSDFEYKIDLSCEIS